MVFQRKARTISLQAGGGNSSLKDGIRKKTAMA